MTNDQAPMTKDQVVAGLQRVVAGLQTEPHAATEGLKRLAENCNRGDLRSKQSAASETRAQRRSSTNV